MRTLDELRMENEAAYRADIHTGEYQRRLAASNANYIPALEAEVERLRARLAVLREVGLLIDGVEFIPLDIVRAHMPFVTPPGADVVAVYVKDEG